MAVGGTAVIGILSWPAYARSPSTAPLQRPFAGPPAFGPCVRVHHTYTKTYKFVHADASRQQHKLACKPAHMGGNADICITRTYDLQWIHIYKTNPTLEKQSVLKMYACIMLVDCFWGSCN